jgi:putative peptidoglycan lipid II flippase
MAVNILASILLRGPLGHGGLALGNSIGVSIEVILLLIIARRRLRGIDERRILKALAHFVAGSIGMAVTIIAVQSIFSVMPLPDALALDEKLRSAIAIGVPLVVAAVIGLIVYVIVASALGSEEVRALPRMILKRRAV